MCSQTQPRIYPHTHISLTFPVDTTSANLRDTSADSCNSYHNLHWKKLPKRLQSHHHNRLPNPKPRLPQHPMPAYTTTASPHLILATPNTVHIERNFHNDFKATTDRIASSTSSSSVTLICQLTYIIATHNHLPTRTPKPTPRTKPNPITNNPKLAPTTDDQSELAKLGHNDTTTTMTTKKKRVLRVECSSY